MSTMKNGLVFFGIILIGTIGFGNAVFAEVFIPEKEFFGTNMSPNIFEITSSSCTTSV